MHQAIVFSLANGHSSALMISIISLLTVTTILALLYFSCVVNYESIWSCLFSDPVYGRNQCQLKLPPWIWNGMFASRQGLMSKCLPISLSDCAVTGSIFCLCELFFCDKLRRYSAGPAPHNPQRHNLHNAPLSPRVKRSNACVCKEIKLKCNCEHWLLQVIIDTWMSPAV